MKALKIFGIVVVIAAFVFGLGIIGRVETEDRQYRSGEIEQEDLTTMEDICKQIGACVGIGLGGGLIWMSASYIEDVQQERKCRRR